MILRSSHLGSSALNTIPDSKDLSLTAAFQQYSDSRKVATIRRKMQRRGSFLRNSVQRRHMIEQQSERVDMTLVRSPVQRRQALCLLRRHLRARLQQYPH